MKHFRGHAAAPQRRERTEVAAARVADIPGRVVGTAVLIQRQRVLTVRSEPWSSPTEKNRTLTFAILAGETNFTIFRQSVYTL